MFIRIGNLRWYFMVLAGVVVLAGLYASSLYNYLLFHGIAELFSIFVAFGIFIIAWNSRHFIDNNYFIFIGVAYLFVGILDLIHTLAYTGMGVFPDYGTNLPAQLWISSRYIESISLLIAPFFISRKLKVAPLLAVYSLVVALLLVSIFYWDIFPVCFVEGSGLTTFKRISEYIISLILLGSIFTMYIKRSQFDVNLLRYIYAAIIVTIASELCFTLYETPYGLANLIGHFLKFISFYFIYKAIIETGLVRPYNLLFMNLKLSEEQYRDLYEEAPNAYMSVGVDGHIQRANRSATELLGYSREELIGRPVSDLYADTPNGWEKAREVFQRFLAGDEIRDEELEIHRADRSSVWINLSVRPIRDARGRVVASRSEIVDVTKRREAEKKLEESENRLNSILSSMVDLIFVFDNNDRITFYQSAADDLYVPPERFLGKRYPEVLPARVNKLTAAAMKKNRKGEAAEFEYWLEMKGQTKWYYAKLSPIFLGDEFTGSVAVVRDITAWKQLEETRIEQAAAIAKAEEIEESRRRIIAVQESLRKDISQQMHGTVQTRLIILMHRLKELERSLPSEQTGAELANLHRELNELLEKNIRPISHRLFPTILRRGIIPALQSLADQFMVPPSIDIEVSAELKSREQSNPKFIAEQARLAVYRIAEEALANVAKHANASQISIMLELSSDGWLQITIRDDGQGFHVTDTSMGQGLLMMHDYAEMLGGDCVISSTPDKGTEVKVTFPVATPGEEHPE